MTSFSDIKDEYVKLSMSRALMNRKSSLGLFYVLMGSLLHQCGMQVKQSNFMDLRLHLMLFQPSRTGKQVALDFMEYMADLLGLLKVQEVQITDAGLVGNIDETTYKANKSSGRNNPEDPEYRNPIILGDFGLYNIVSFPEAKILFKDDNKFTKDLLDIIQMVCDTNGLVRKKRTYEVPLEYQSRTSLIGTTYFLEDEFGKVLTRQGIFQRFLILHDPFPTEKRELVGLTMNYSGVVERRGDEIVEVEVPQDIIEKIDHEIVPWDEIDGRAESLRDRILESVNSYEKDFVMYKSREAAEVLSQYEKQRYNSVRAHFVGSEIETIESFLTSLNVMHHKLAAISAVLNCHDFIEEIDVIETHEVINMCYEAVVNDIVGRLKGADPDSIESSIINLLIKEGPKGLNRKQIINKLAQKFHFQDKKIGNVIKRMIGKNMLIQNENRLRLSKGGR